MLSLALSGRTKIRYDMKATKHPLLAHVLTAINTNSSVPQTDINNRDDRPAVLVEATLGASSI